MAAVETVKTSQEQAIAAWAQQLHDIRLLNLLEKLASQDINFESAIAEIQKLKEFISQPAHILGSIATKHGEVAEHVQVRFSNADRLVEGQTANHSFEGVARNAMEDYLRDGKMVQSKFLAGPKATFNAITNHLKDYPDYLRQDGSYDIPKDQYDLLTDILKRGANNRSSLGKQPWGNEETLYKTICQWEQENGVKFQDVVHPSVAEYDEVQLGTVERTIQREEATLRQKDEAIREQARDASKPTIREGAKVIGVSAAVEAGTAFAIKIYQKKKSGKKIKDFTEQDWLDVGIGTGLGGVKGGIRGGALFVAANYTPVPAPIANALVSATYGIVAQAYKLEKGDITPEEFLDASEVLCLDVSVSAVSSIVGQAIIPIPVLGAVIGNAVGMYMQEISKSYLLEREQKLIDSYFLEAQQHNNEIAKRDMETTALFNANLAEYASLLALSFSEDANLRHEGAVQGARLAGVPEEKILHNLEEGEALFQRT